jgi:hypothetical protein
MYGGDVAVVSRIHIEKVGYSVNACVVLRKSPGRSAEGTQSTSILNYSAVFSVSPCQCPVLANGHFLSHHFPFTSIRSFEATRSKLLTPSLTLYGRDVFCFTE